MGAALGAALDRRGAAGALSPRSDDAERPPRAARRAVLAAACAAGLVLAPGLAQAAASAEAMLKRADRTLGTPQSLRFEATGTGATLGQAFEPGGPWPKLAFSQFVRTMDCANGAMREDTARSRTEPTGGGAVPLMGTGEQRIQGFVAGRHACNLVGPAPVPVPVALETRLHDLWTSPHGVIAAARRNAATVDFVTEKGRSLAAVSFVEPGVMKATAYLDGDGLVERVEATIPHPVTGDTKVVTEYMDYRPQRPVSFPSRIRQSHFGQLTLELAVGKVEANPATGFAVPELVSAFTERVATTPVVPGVWVLAGGSHSRVLIEMKDHLALVETPLYDGRSAEVIAEARKLAPCTPIRTVINSHHHIDHAGGLRTAAAEGIELMVATPAQPHLAKVLANPDRIKPDSLAASKRAASRWSTCPPRRCRSRPMRTRRARRGAATFPRTRRRRRASADDHLGDLELRLDVRVVGHVGHDRLAVRGHARLERLERLDEERARRDERRRRTGCAAAEALVDGIARHRGAELLLDHRHVPVAVVRVVEGRAGLVRVHHGHLEHRRLPGGCRA